MNYDNMTVDQLKDELIRTLKAQVANLEKQLRIWEELHTETLHTLNAQVETLEELAPMKEAIEKARYKN